MYSCAELFLLGEPSTPHRFPNRCDIGVKPLGGENMEKNMLDLLLVSKYFASQEKTQLDLNGEENLYAMKNQISIEKMNKIHVQSAITDVYLM